MGSAAAAAKNRGPHCLGEEIQKVQPALGVQKPSLKSVPIPTAESTGPCGRATAATLHGATNGRKNKTTTRIAVQRVASCTQINTKRTPSPCYRIKAPTLVALPLSAEQNPSRLTGCALSRYACSSKRRSSGGWAVPLFQRR